jgi:hypothetical protein
MKIKIVFGYKYLIYVIFHLLAFYFLPFAFLVRLLLYAAPYFLNQSCTRFQASSADCLLYCGR